jgi:hypothetical protein
MTATRKHSTKRKPVAVPSEVPCLYLALELGWNEWKLAFSTGPTASPRLRAIGGRRVGALLDEIAKAKKRFGLPEDAPVHSGYEAGRDGFWLHRFSPSLRTFASKTHGRSFRPFSFGHLKVQVV